MALQVVGKCLGLKSTPAKDAGKPPMITGGVSFPVADGFADQETVLEVRFFPQQIDRGLHHHFQANIGKQVAVPVSVKARAFNGQAYVDYNCAGELVVLEAAAARKVANA